MKRYWTLRGREVEQAVRNRLIDYKGRRQRGKGDWGEAGEAGWSGEARGKGASDTIKFASS